MPASASSKKKASRNKTAKKIAESKASVPDKLIVAGETLIGERGLEGLSLREVSALAGTRNNYAVQYHFGDAAGLIRAIISQRTAEIEARRAEKLNAQGDPSTISARTLMEIFFRPLIEFVDARGIPRFGRFILALDRSPDGWRPLNELLFMMPVTARLLDLMKVANPEIPAHVNWQRMRPISVMVLTYACSPVVIGSPQEYRESVITDLLDMAAAALTVPVRKTATDKDYGLIY